MATRGYCRKCQLIFNEGFKAALYEGTKGHRLNFILFHSLSRETSEDIVFQGPKPPGSHDQQAEKRTDEHGAGGPIET